MAENFVEFLGNLHSSQTSFDELARQYFELQTKNERLEKALDIATGYVRDDSSRTYIGKLYDIEQARKGE